MESRITILCENTISRSGLIGEHGFSLLIELENEKYLFDTGPGLSLPYNLKSLGKNLDGLDGIIISHGHYDHTGGLKWAIKKAGPVQVVAHPAIFSRHMVYNPDKPNEAPCFVGCPHAQRALEELGAHFNFISRTEKIASRLWFITGINRLPGQFPYDSRLVMPEQGHLVPDPIRDDASLLLECEGPPVLILGCAHSGVLNILDHIRDKMSTSKLRAILGGTHLMFTSPKDIPRVIDKLEGFSIELIGVSHCTGFKAIIELAKHFEDRFKMASAGTTFVF